MGYFVFGMELALRMGKLFHPYS